MLIAEHLMPLAAFSCSRTQAPAAPGVAILDPRLDDRPDTTEDVDYDRNERRIA